MSVFGMDPAWLSRLWPKQTHHWHTHISHAAVALVIFGGNGYWIGAALPWFSGWQGIQIGGGVGLLFYLVREMEAHLFYRNWHRDGAITKAEYKLHLWDSRLDFLVPLAVVLPVIGHEWDIWRWVGGLWAVVILHYIHKPPGFAGGMRG